MIENTCIYCDEKTENTDSYDLLEELELPNGEILEEGNTVGPLCDDCEDELESVGIIDTDID